MLALGRHALRAQLVRALRLHVDAALELGTVLQRYPRGNDVSPDASGLPQQDLFFAVQISLDFPFDGDQPAINVGLDAPALSHGNVILLQINLALDLTLDDQILTTRAVAFYRNRGPDRAPLLPGPAGIPPAAAAAAAAAGGSRGRRRLR